MAIARQTELTIGSKNFSESFILSEILAILLEEEYGYEINRKLGLGGTKVAFDALTSGSIDLYPDYTGTGYSMILGMSGETDADKIYNIVSKKFAEQFNIIWGPPLGLNNTYALAVRRDDSRFKNIRNVSELSNRPLTYIFGTPHEFMERADGLRNFVKTYNLKFDPGNIRGISSGLMYKALEDGQVDLIMSYSTDGRIKAYNLKLLEDDKNFFPPYYAAFILRKEILEAHPRLKKAMDKLAGIISDEIITDLNDQVDRKKIPPAIVARNFLINHELIEGKIIDPGKQSGFWQYLFANKKYLLNLTQEHLYLTFFSLALAVLFSLPLGVLMTRNKKIADFVFPVVNITQTVPSLALLGFLLPVMGIGSKPAIVALFLYSLLPLIRNIYAGISAVDPLLIEAAKGLGLTRLQTLMKVELPLALPVILAGIRTASVIVVGTATIAALVGAGGLGEPIFRGMATVNNYQILLGAIPAALLAIAIDKLIGIAEVVLVSKGLRLVS